MSVTTAAAPVIAETSHSHITDVQARQKAFFRTGATKDVKYRLEALKKLRKAIKAATPELLDALKQDLNKCAFEGYAAEVGFVLDEIDHTIKNLRVWAEPEVVATPLTQFLSSGKVYNEPYGQTLIIAPWNYPFQLTIAPLIGAIAAGNTAVIKPSEVSAHTCKAVAKLLKSTFGEEFVAVVEGGVETNQALLDHKWDYIFFTGSPYVGHIVAQAAAKTLTPYTLELGGKSPVLVDHKISLAVTARRIVWGAFFNAGQTCIAPDYLLVDRQIKDALITEMIKAIEQFYGKDPKTSDSFGRIINDKHFNRLTAYLADGNVVYGGQHDASQRYIQPTLLTDVDPESPVMQNEIFGPIVPILTYDKLDQALDFVNSRPHPLALYIFSNRSEYEETVLRNTHSGGGCVNDTLVHLTSPDMPFGGVGNSGVGAYHGKASFDTFSQKRSYLKKAIFPDMDLRYPPYTDSKLKMAKRLIG